MADETITGGEFARFRVDLSARLDRQDRAIDEGFRGVHRRQDDANGRTTKNAEGLIRVETHLDTIEAQVMDINEKAKQVEPIASEVKAIHEHGCAKLEEHNHALGLINGDPMDPAGWGRRKKAIVGGGLIAAGATLIPLLQEFVRVVHDVVEHFGVK